jgi:LEA14-like dessication related protein
MTFRFTFISAVCLFSILLFFSSCRNLKEVECSGVKGFKVNSIDTKGLDGDVMLGLKNPNALSFNIYPSEFDITFSGIYLGKAKLSKVVRINANTEANYSFNLKKDFKDINLLDVMKLLNGSMNKGLIEVKGDLKVGKFYYKKKFPVSVQEKINLN